MARKPYIGGHHVKLIHGGEEYFSLLVDLIRSASFTIQIHVYILQTDKTGIAILDELVVAHNRGVKVFLLMDGFGSYHFDKVLFEKYKSKGIDLKYFHPFSYFNIGKIGRRLHHKVIVIDSKKLLLGGINISNKYHGTPTEKPWLDYAVLVEGSIASHTEKVCLQIWNRKYRNEPSMSHLLKQRSWEPMLVRMTQNDWFRQKNQIASAYKYMLDEAKKDIIIVASYFIPTRRLLKILIHSANKGVRVRIVLSRESDVAMLKGAITYLYQKLLRNNIEIYEYRTSILHAKVCIVDKEWTTIGSHNLNYLSEFFSIEMNIDILDKSFAENFTHELEEIIKTDCIKITKDEFHKSMAWYNKLMYWIQYKISSIIIHSLYFLNKKEGFKNRKID